MSVTRILARPYPPESLIDSDHYTSPDTFVPANDLQHWIYDAYISEAGPLYNEAHHHLASARIGVLWTNSENAKAGRRVLGQAEMPDRIRSPRWQKARMEQQLREWFGIIPDFLITFDAFFADGCDDRTWCALVSHELFHCAQATDQFGMPKFNKDTGEPVFTMAGHEIEAFVADVERYGAEALGEEVVDFVIAAAKMPQVSDVQIAAACGRKLPLKKGVANAG